MIVIKRGKEPNSLLKFRKENPDADYESDMPTDVLKDIREQMWEEQRCLCAYCMKKIIYSEDAEINKDVTETLNLNCQTLSLPQTRKNVLMAEKDRIMRKCKGKSQDAFIRELERTYGSLVQERNLTPYCGIIISWLESKLKIS